MLFHNYRTDVVRVSEDSLEGKAIKLKRLKSNIDQLSIAYERAQDALTSLVERQKAASKEYDALKKDLLNAALELEDPSDNNLKEE